MNRKYLNVIFGFILLLVPVLLFGCSSTGTDKKDQPKNASEQAGQGKGVQQPYEFKWATAPSGSVMQVIGTAILQDVTKSNPKISGSILPGNVTANLMGIGQGQYNLVFSTSDTTAEAWSGSGFFKDKGQIRNFSNVATLYPHMSQIVVRADSGINSIPDLKGKKVTPATMGLSNDVEMQRLLKLYGIDTKELNVQYMDFNDAAQQFSNKQLDALFFTTLPVPHPSIVNVSSQNKLKFLPVPQDKIDEMVKSYQGLMAVELPSNTYSGQTEPVPGIGLAMHLVVRNDAPEEVVYELTKVIAENLTKYQGVVANMKFLKKPEDLAQNVGIPFHPGAEKYYKEKGWIK